MARTKTNEHTHRFRRCCTFSKTHVVQKGGRDERSTPVLLQGGEVGQQPFIVKLLQLQELDGPLVW